MERGDQHTNTLSLDDITQWTNQFLHFRSVRSMQNECKGMECVVRKVTMHQTARNDPEYHACILHQLVMDALDGKPQQRPWDRSSPASSVVHRGSLILARRSLTDSTLDCLYESGGGGGGGWWFERRRAQSMIGGDHNNNPVVIHATLVENGSVVQNYVCVMDRRHREAAVIHVRTDPPTSSSTPPIPWERLFLTLLGGSQTMIHVHHLDSYRSTSPHALHYIMWLHAILTYPSLGVRVVASLKRMEQDYERLASSHTSPASSSSPSDLCNQKNAMYELIMLDRFVPPTPGGVQNMIQKHRESVVRRIQAAEPQQLFSI